jgi:preprotein translocase subunit SecD
MVVATENGHDLSPTEVAKLENFELVIESGLKSFIEVGRALLEIRDGRLYRLTHDTFEDYCQERWDMSRRYANMLVAAADVVDDLGTTVPKPQNESQVRPLTKLPETQRAAAWKEAVETAPNGKVTAAHVEKVVATRLPADQADKDEPQRDAELSKSEAESKAIRDEFTKRLSIVSDGSVYTLDSLEVALQVKKWHATEFVRMCEVSPAVVVHRTFGAKGLMQFTFVRTNCVTGHERIRQLAEQIATDPTSSGKAHAAAAKILTLLGG